jgi:prepilin-type N-terminal cleavage/methylation domain-containing protein/prepilin-type processing-associated H-X9-DG protein
VPCRDSQPRPGFTLIELLVVIAILAVLLGLFFPAVQKVRRTAARMQCANQLRQVGLAMHSHHDQAGLFPHGGCNKPPLPYGAEDNRAEWSWAYQILPYLEQEGLHKAPTDEVDSTPVKTFYCPTRRSPAAIYGKAKMDYAGNAGTNLGGVGDDGVIVKGPKRRIRLADLTDGSGCTVLVAEKQLNPDYFGITADDNKWYNRPGWNGDYEAYRRGDAQPGRDEGCGFPLGHESFGSAHLAGFNVCFADGSVRHVRYDVDLKTWTLACVRNDRRVFSLNEL